VGDRVETILVIRRVSWCQVVRTSFQTAWTKSFGGSGGRYEGGVPGPSSNAYSNLPKLSRQSLTGVEDADWATALEFGSE
jgi:hypothetical protein